MDKATIAQVQSFGFDVYMRNESDTWLLFTDGTRIGYLQNHRYGGFSISTVHKPNSKTGSGFQMHEGVEIDHQKLEAGFMFAPSWASDRNSVVKYRDIEEYINRDSFTRSYTKVPA